MEHDILHALARHQLYAQLARKLREMDAGCLGFLSEQRRLHMPQLKNDAYFYGHISGGQKIIKALAQFCEQRRDGHEYKDSLQALMKKFEPETRSAFTLPGLPVMAGADIHTMAGQGDDTADRYFRQSHIDEFTVVVHMLRQHLHQHVMKEFLWAQDAVCDSIVSQVDGFADPQQAEKGFRSYPEPPEAKLIRDAVDWLQQRGRSARIARTIVAHQRMSLAEMFSRANMETMASLVGCETHCALMASGLGNMLASGKLSMFLCNMTLKQAPANKGLAIAFPVTRLKLDQRRLLHDIVTGYVEFILQSRAAALAAQEELPPFDAQICQQLERLAVDMVVALTPPQVSPAARRRAPKPLEKIGNIA